MCEDNRAPAGVRGVSHAGSLATCEHCAHAPTTSLRVLLDTHRRDVTRLSSFLRRGDYSPRLVARTQDADAMSTVKLGTALVVYPLWAAGLVTLSFMLVPPPLSLAAATIVIVSPFAALAWLDAYWNRTPTHEATPDELAQLARLRIAARTAIDDARAKLGA